ncbi:Leucine-rich repeat-containing protein 74A [Larimichthys crocea]|uniref:Uncharacterized protein n=1 Tax=Larimichthys crocea TaxID=215358 RepID=A0ACD3R040_LARCR|nr:Leucine-rich repeat-containing protein 74A [Larimichthys crocea]
MEDGAVLDQTEDEELPPQDQDGDPGDEWDTDLETDDATSRRQCLSRAELYLQACQEIGVHPVSSFLRNLNETSLNLNHYGVGPLGAKALARALGEDRVITHLELEDNTLGATGTHYLMEMLILNNSIESLNLSNNQLQRKGAKIVSTMLADNYKIKSIKLSGNEFGDSAIKYIAEVLKGDYVVTELDLSNNKFYDAGGEYLGHMLGSNLGIEDLNLSWNHLSMRGAAAVCAALKLNSTLKHLHLSWNGFGHFGTEKLGQALKQNSTLVLLDLSCNHIDDEAVTLLCQGLAANNTLRVLKLSPNPITNVGALTLLTTVKNNKNSAVEEIDISSVFVCEAFVELLEEARQRRPALDVRYSVMSSVTRNISALQVFQKFLKMKNETIMDFFQALDKEGTMKVSTSAFRTAVKEANVPLDQRQLEWLVKKFDKSCSATIMYSQFAELS